MYSYRNDLLYHSKSNKSYHIFVTIGGDFFTLAARHWGYSVIPIYVF